MADYWIKLYLEILDDSKMAVLPDRLWRRVIELFLMAGRFRQDGSLPETRQLAWILRMPSDDLEMDLQQIAGTGIMQKVVNGWFIPKFSKRQAAVPASERMQAMRERQHHKQYADESVTEELRNVTQINRLTDTESDTESEATNEFSLLPLSKAFVEASGLPELAGGPQQYYTALQEMKTAGVTPEDLRQAITELRDKGYTIVRPRSCVVAAINVTGKKHSKNGKADSAGIHFDNVGAQ